MTKNRFHNLFAVSGFIAMCCGVALIFVILPWLVSHEPLIRNEGIIKGDTATGGVQHFVFRALAKTQEYSSFDFSQVDADSFVAIDSKTGDVLLEKNADSPHSLASLTKLITVGMLFEQGLEESEGTVHTRTIQDALQSYAIPLDPKESVSKIHLFEQQVFSSHDLLQAALIGSANDAIFAFVESQGLTVESFRKKMDAYLVQHGATHTNINEPSGLDWRNESTAREYAALALASLSYDDIRTITQQQSTTIHSLSSSAAYNITTTNDLLGQSDYVIGGKTGYLEASGYTFTILAKHTSGREIIIVLFGAPSKLSRVDDTASIVRWLDINYS